MANRVMTPVKPLVWSISYSAWMAWCATADDDENMAIAARARIPKALLSFIGSFLYLTFAGTGMITYGL